MMHWMSKSNVLIVGLGLMGGSYAMALKRLGYHVCALARRQETVDYALEHGIIDEGSASVDAELVGKADAVVFALYPTAFKEWIRDYQHLLKPGALITDVTGVKRCIVTDSKPTVITASINNDREDRILIDVSTALTELLRTSTVSTPATSSTDEIVCR